MRLFMGGMGGAILENLGKYKIQMFRKDSMMVDGSVKEVV